MKHLIQYSLIFTALSVVMLGCGKSSSGPNGATVQSAAFSPTGASALGTFFATTTVTTFKICVKRIELDGDDDKPVKKEGEVGDNGEANPDDIKFAPGLIDLSDGTAKSWGNVTIPAGFNLKRIKVKIKKDKALCGTEYSVKFNEFEDPRDVEFRFRFNPSVPISSTSPVLTLSFKTVVDALKAAADAGTLAGSKIKEAVEVDAAEGAAQKDKD